jgi:putative nucleotidyltransferase with HDIG domain
MTPLLHRAFEKIRKNPVIPAFSPSAQEFYRISQQPKASYNDVLKIVEIDPGLTAQFLRLANSSVYQRGEPTTNLRTALMRLGMVETCKTGMLISIVHSLKSVEMCEDPFQFWVHSLLTARISARFAEKYKVTVEHAYLAGLLHDIGAIFLEHYFPEEFRQLEQSDEELMYESEKIIFDTNHAELGYALVSTWGVDDTIARAIYFHHRPETLRAEDPARHLAECVLFAGSAASHAESCFDQKLEDSEFNFLTQEYEATQKIISQLVAKSARA